MKNIFLIGYMGTGKSTVAFYLTEHFSMNIVEMDQMIEEQEEMTISDIFKTHGEEYFRDLETNLLLKIRSKENQVVSCGGGVVLRDKNVTEMKKSGYIVLLTAKPETILQRVANDDNRPLLQGNKNVIFIEKMMEQRRRKYEAAADVMIHTDDKMISEICDEILESIKQFGD